MTENLERIICLHMVTYNVEGMASLDRLSEICFGLMLHGIAIACLQGTRQRLRNSNGAAYDILFNEFFIAVSFGTVTNNRNDAASGVAILLS